MIRKEEITSSCIVYSLPRVTTVKNYVYDEEAIIS